LWPGQFVSARIILRVDEDALTLPEGAVQPGQDGPFVFVVKDGRARARNVTVDRQLGPQVVIAKGLAGDEQIIIEVPPTLTDGSQIVLAGEGKGGGTGGKAGKAGKGGKAKAADAGESDAKSAGAAPPAVAKDEPGNVAKSADAKDNP